MNADLIIKCGFILWALAVAGLVTWFAWDCYRVRQWSKTVDKELDKELEK